MPGITAVSVGEHPPQTQLRGGATGVSITDAYRQCGVYTAKLVPLQTYCGSPGRPSGRSRAGHRNAKFLEETNKSFRLARNLRLLHDLASPIHNANAREFQRDVDSCIVLHGCPPSQMPGADSTS